MTKTTIMSVAYQTDLVNEMVNEAKRLSHTRPKVACALAERAVRALVDHAREAGTQWELYEIVDMQVFDDESVTTWFAPQGRPDLTVEIRSGSSGLSWKVVPAPRETEAKRFPVDAILDVLEARAARRHQAS